MCLGNKFRAHFYVTIYFSGLYNYDTYGWFRALHSHKPAQYSHIVKHTLHFYAFFAAMANIGVGL